MPAAIHLSIFYAGSKSAVSKFSVNRSLPVCIKSVSHMPVCMMSVSHLPVSMMSLGHLPVSIK